MFFYKVVSSHWPSPMEFKSELEMEVGQCFRILAHNGTRKYPTRMKVIDVSDTPKYSGNIVNILSVDTNVDTF